MDEEKKWYHTSQPGSLEVSATVRSAVMMFVPLLVLILQHLHVVTDESTVANVLDELLIGISGVGVLFGLARKAYFRFFYKPKQ